MNFLGFNKLSGQKRKEMILVVLLTVGILAALGFGLIKYQFGVLAGLQDKQAAVNRRLDEMHNMVRRASLTEDELAISRQRLSKLEEDMPSRDLYFWIDVTLRRFKQSYKVDIPQVSQPAVGKMDLLPDFPYQQASYRVSGTARYQELGRFLADFENQFPYARLTNLQINPASSPGEPGLLSFSVFIVTLINPNPS